MDTSKCLVAGLLYHFEYIKKWKRDFRNCLRRKKEEMLVGAAIAAVVCVQRHTYFAGSKSRDAVEPLCTMTVDLALVPDHAYR